MKTADLPKGTEVVIESDSLERIYGWDWSRSVSLGGILHELGASSPTGIPVHFKDAVLHGVVLRSGLEYGSARRKIGVELRIWKVSEPVESIIVILPCQSIRWTWQQYQDWRSELRFKIELHKMGVR